MSKIISVNAGSSSLKFQLFEMDDETVITSGVIERIGLEDSIFTIKFNGEKDVRTLPIPTHKEAVHLLLDTLLEKNKIVCIEGKMNYRDKLSLVVQNVKEVNEV